MRTRTIAIATLPLLSALFACGSAPPPKELVDARAAYQRAAAGPAKDYKPDELHVAKDSLEAAEKTFNDDGGDAATTRDRSYVAVRKIELAEADARLAMDEKQKTDAQNEAAQLRGDKLNSAQNELAQTKQQLEKSRDALEREKAAREAAEKKAAQAMADLQRIASVKQESRGMVITLSGAVLFASNESTLLPAAMVKLNDVADALVKGNPDSNMVVEGHTDSQGQHDYNQQLSQKRADSVRDYLVSRGIAQDRIKSQGFGPDRPIADNKTPEGRANNRRVEIVVQPASPAAH